MAANFQLIPSEDARKRTKNVHPYMQFYFIEKKAKNVSCDFYDEVLRLVFTSGGVGVGVVVGVIRVLMT